MRTAFLLALLLLSLPTVAAAQAPITPGDQIAIDLADPGQMRSGTSTVTRPHTNIAFEYRIDGGAPVAAAKARSCVAATPAPAMTCYLTAPALTPGAHTIEVRALPFPAETGVTPGAFSSPLTVAMIMVSSPGTPTNLRPVASQP